jgi:hypothetical protein
MGANKNVHSRKSIFFFIIYQQQKICKFRIFHFSLWSQQLSTTPESERTFEMMNKYITKKNGDFYVQVQDLMLPNCLKHYNAHMTMNTTDSHHKMSSTTFQNPTHTIY